MPLSSSKSSSPSHPYPTTHIPKKQLTPIERAMIIGAHKCSASYTLISARLGFPRSTIHNTIKNATVRESCCMSRPRPGRPKKLDKGDRERIVEAIERNPKVTNNELREIIGASVCNRTLMRFRKEMRVARAREGGGDGLDGGHNERGKRREESAAGIGCTDSVVHEYPITPSHSLDGNTFLPADLQQLADFHGMEGALES
ncbi:MAG: hypothetical protein M1834_003273 [Cirrosporium novae-zelandiae]|nr:MAG: hypothetical protein M1834_003273 [Cirrosporium novae-zelandiae]